MSSLQIFDSLSFNNTVPETFNHLTPTRFRLFIKKLPLISFFVQTCEIPGITLGTAKQETPLVDIPRSGDKLTFGELEISFLVQETMANYKELYDWVMGIGFPTGRDQFSQAYGRGVRKNDNLEYSDVALLVLGSNQQPIAQFTFFNAVPTSLSGLKFGTKEGDTDYIEASARFAYMYYEFKPLVL